METVQLFITCLIDTFQPQIGEAVVETLTRCQVKVEFPTEQTCCGQPAFNAGMRAEARRTAVHTIQVFENTTGPIVIPSGSCTAMIRHGYPELFANDPQWLPRAKAIAQRTYEFTEFLVDHLGRTEFGVHFAGTITYHPSCHLLRGLGIDRQPRALLAQVQDATLVELPHGEECCGFGGIFSVKHPEISTEMLQRKISNIQATNTPTVVVCDTGCLLHIRGGLHRRGAPQNIIHIAELLAKGSC